MKKIRQSYIRWTVLGLLSSFVLFTSISSDAGEWYARKLYPGISKILSALSSPIPFSLDEWIVVGLVFLLVSYPFYARLRKKTKWLFILAHEVELLLWIYVWFYWGWGMNYYRYNFFQRAEVSPAKYDETVFKAFLSAYTDSLRSSYVACKEMGIFNSVNLFEPYSKLLEEKNTKTLSTENEQSANLELADPNKEEFFTAASIQDEIKRLFGKVPSKYGLALPMSYQHPKRMSFNSLYSNVAVVGFMGPFFSESHMNSELNILEYPFTYAHELSHLLGVSNEAEANLWAYIICTQSSDALIRFCGYFGLFSYLWPNNHFLLSQADFEKWEAFIPSEVMAAFYRSHAHWSIRYNKTLGELQSAMYNFYLRRNRISTGMKNYSQVIGLLLSLPDHKLELE